MNLKYMINALFYIYFHVHIMHDYNLLEYYRGINKNTNTECHLT